tara:strand:- start:583 stop:1488 length:906 start_codon:yes stop_codon:yes gene_type:complete
MPNNKTTDKYKHAGLGADPSLQEITMMPSNFETVDYALYDFVNERLNPSISTNKGFEKVQVLWVTAERAFQLKHNKEIRDSEETLILPLITIERTSVVKDQSRRGLPYANIYPVNDVKGGTITVARRINQDKTGVFQNAMASRKINNIVGHGQQNHPSIKNKKVVYETITMPLPTWIVMTYSVTLRTEYQQQMNELMRIFVSNTGNSRMPSRIERDGHKFEAFIQESYELNNNVASMEMEQRNFETTINIEVLGYIIGEGENQERPKIVIRENVVEIKIPRERVILGDIPQHIDDRGFYKE